MKHSIFIILFIIFSISGKAQTTITGKVSNKNGDPLPGATVYLLNQNQETLCNNEGQYIIEHIPNGKIQVQFSYIGYNSEVKSIIVRQGKNELNVSLSETNFEIQEIVVSGGIISSQRDNAVKIDVLKNKNIMLSGTPNLMEALTSIPGVDMISKGQGMSKPVIRGLSMNGILIARDGTRIENYQYSVGHPAGIDDNGIGKVEIIKGPASLLYGSDAIGGVINFVGAFPAPKGKIEGNYQTQFFSNSLGSNNSLSLKGASKHFYAGISANYKTHADYKQGGGDYVPNSRFNEWSTNIKAGYNAKIGTFNLSYYYYKQQVGITVPAAIALINKRGRKNDIWYQNPHHHLISSHNKLYFGQMRCDVNLAWQSNLRSAYNVTDIPFVEMRLNTFTYETKIHLPSNEKSDYIIGIQGMTQAHRNINNRISQSLADANVQRFGAMGYVQHTFNKLKLQGGIRLDFGTVETKEKGEDSLSEHYIIPNGSFGATYRLNEKITLRANFAKACRMPNLRELLFTGIKGNRYEVADKDLTQEDAYESDISLHYQNRCISIDAALFYNHINNYIYLSPTADTTTSGIYIFKTTQNDANLYGGEAGLHYHPLFAPWLHIKGTYSSVVGKRKNNEYLPYIPAHKFRYEIGFEKKTAWIFNNPAVYISALTALSQDNPSQFETSTDGYTIFNTKANANIKISKQLITIGLAINNIFDKKYIDHLSTLKSINYYNPGRNISLILKIPLGIK